VLVTVAVLVTVLVAVLITETLLLSSLVMYAFWALAPLAKAMANAAAPDRTLNRFFIPVAFLSPAGPRIDCERRR